MSEPLTPWEIAGKVLRRLIKENYGTQENFALDYGTDLRSVSRYVNGKLSSLIIIQELAMWFKVDFRYFFDESNF